MVIVVERSKLGAVFESMKRHDMLFLVFLPVEDYHISIYIYICDVHIELWSFPPFSS